MYLLRIHLPEEGGAGGATIHPIFTTAIITYIKEIYMGVGLGGIRGGGTRYHQVLTCCIFYILSMVLMTKF